MQVLGLCWLIQVMTWMQVSFYRSNLFLKVVPKAKGQDEEGNDIQLESMIEYIW